MENLTQKAQEVAHILKLLSHPKRFMILCRLKDGPKTVSDLEKYCTIGQSQLSQFLIKMRDEGLLGSEKQGQYVLYSIRDTRIVSLLVSIQEIFCK